MSDEMKQWRCAYCAKYKTSKLKPISSGCSKHRDSKTGKPGLHRWERIK